MQRQRGTEYPTNSNSGRMTPEVKKSSLFNQTTTDNSRARASENKTRVARHPSRPEANHDFFPPNERTNQRPSPPNEIAARLMVNERRCDITHETGREGGIGSEGRPMLHVNRDCFGKNRKTILSWNLSDSIG